MSQKVLDQYSTPTASDDEQDKPQFSFKLGPLAILKKREPKKKMRLKNKHSFMNETLSPTKSPFEKDEGYVDKLVESTNPVDERYKTYFAMEDTVR